MSAKKGRFTAELQYKDDSKNKNKKHKYLGKLEVKSESVQDCNNKITLEIKAIDLPSKAGWVCGKPDISYLIIEKFR